MTIIHVDLNASGGVVFASIDIGGTLYENKTWAEIQALRNAEDDCKESWSEDNPPAEPKKLTPWVLDTPVSNVSVSINGGTAFTPNILRKPDCCEVPPW